MSTAARYRITNPNASAGLLNISIYKSPNPSTYPSTDPKENPSRPQPLTSPTLPTHPSPLPTPPLHQMSPPPLIPPLALIFTAYSLLISLLIFLRPLSAITLFGLPLPPSSTKKEFVPLIYCFGGRNLALGLASVGFWAGGMGREMGVVLG